MELVGYEDVEARSHEALASLVVHQGKVIEVQMISSNEDTIISFMNEIKKFEV